MTSIQQIEILWNPISQRILIFLTYLKIHINAFNSMEFMDGIKMEKSSAFYIVKHNERFVICCLKMPNFVDIFLLKQKWKLLVRGIFWVFLLFKFLYFNVSSEFYLNYSIGSTEMVVLLFKVLLIARHSDEARPLANYFIVFVLEIEVFEV